MTPRANKTAVPAAGAGENQPQQHLSSQQAKFSWDGGGGGGRKKKGGQAPHPFTVVTMRTLEATVNQRSSPTQRNPSSVPHPYHTNYVPKLPPSTQDSELQSMSSDADSFSMTESGNDMVKRIHMNKRQDRKEMLIRYSQQHHNLESNLKETIIPRTMREGTSTSQGKHETPEQRMEFYKILCEKLEAVLREREKDEKLSESLRQLSESSTCGSNPIVTRRAAEEYSIYVKSVQKLEDDTDILDQHMQQLGWDDSAKASPRRSPGASLLHPKSRPTSGSKSPDRWNHKHGSMVSSYPSGGMFMGQSRAGVGVFGVDFNGMGNPCTQGMLPYQKSRPSNHHHQSSSANTATRTSGSDKRQPPPSRARGGKPLAASDTSGIESGTSSGASQVSAMIIPPQHLENSKSRKQTTSGSHRPSSHKGTVDRPQKGQKTIDSASLPRPKGTRRSEPVSFASAMPSVPCSVGQSQPQQFYQQQQLQVQQGVAGGGSGNPTTEVSVGYYLPNEPVPYVHKTNRPVTLKLFRTTILPKKFQEPTRYKYFFKCASDEFEIGGVVNKEVTNDSEVLPMWEGKIMAKVEVR